LYTAALENHRITKPMKKQFFRKKYYEFGPTLAQEMLFERDGLEISVSTLRRALLSYGLWKQKKNSSEYRIRREPRARFGELVQFDGSRRLKSDTIGLKATGLIAALLL
jgi:hypothetical protein